MKSHYSKMLNYLEEIIEDRLQEIILEGENKGGIRNTNDYMIHPGSGIGYLLYIVQLYYNKDSKYYREERLYTYMEYILEYLEKVQRPDGTFDSLISNFWSSPDVAFLVHVLAPTYRIIDAYGIDLKDQAIRQRVLNIVIGCGDGMTEGGFHTPNHRWMVASALLICHNIVKKEMYKEMAQRYLAEGIDCNEYGEFTEKSAGMYNAVNDEALIVIAEELGDFGYLEYVKKNLEMMTYYYEPDDTIFTQNSGRSDKGETDISQKWYPIRYYKIYTYMAYNTGDRQSAYLANQVFERAIKQGTGLPILIYFYMLNPQYKEREIEEKKCVECYNRFFEESGIIRMRDKELSVTLLKDKSAFLFLQLGEFRCYLKMAASFFSVAQFRAQKIIPIDNGYRLYFETHGRYLLPYNEPVVTTDWDKIDHSKREIVTWLNLIMEVDVEFIPGGVALHIHTDGCDRVPFKIDICMTPGCMLENEEYLIKGNKGKGLILKEGNVKVTYGKDSVLIGPGFGKHTEVYAMRGAEGQSGNDFTIFLSDFTPIERVIEIKKVEKERGK